MKDESGFAAPHLSVIMCVRNGASVIEGQLRALAAQQTDVSWELVVVDNGSEDHTVAVVRAATEDFPAPVTIVDAAERAGICFARNVGASAARGELLAFCDCDDEVEPGWVGAAAEALRHHHIAAGALRELGSGSTTDAVEIEGGAYVAASFGGAVIGCNFAARRDSYFEIGGFDESLPPYGCDDVEFSIRANKAGLRVGRSDDMVVHFRRTTGTREILRKTYLSAQAEAVVWFRHADRYGDMVRPRTLLVRLLTAVPSAVTALVSGRPARSVIRGAVTRWGNAVGYWRLVRNDGGSPQLVHAPVVTHRSPH